MLLRMRWTIFNTSKYIYIAHFVEYNNDNVYMYTYILYIYMIEPNQWCGTKTVNGAMTMCWNKICYWYHINESIPTGLSTLATLIYTLGACTDEVDWHKLFMSVDRFLHSRTIPRYLRLIQSKTEPFFRLTVSHCLLAV